VTAPRLVDRLRASPLGVQLVLFSAVVTALVVGTSFFVLRGRATADVRRTFAGELARSQQALRALQERDLQLLLATSGLVSTSPTLRAALETARVEGNAGLAARPVLVATIRREAEQVFADLDRDLLVVADDRGRVLVALRRGDGPTPSGDLANLPAVRHALESDVTRADSSFGVVRLGGVAFQVGSAAIIVQGFPSGVLVLGDRFDRIVPRLGVGAGIDLVVAAGPEVLAAAPESLSTLVREALAAAEPPDAAPRQVRIAGEEYVAATLPLGLMDDGRPVTLHLLRSLTTAIGPLDQALRRSFLLAALLAVLLASLGAAGIARTTLEPLRRFVAFLGSGAERGSYARFASSAAPAEIATLTGTYNRLIESLEREHATIEERTTQLAATNESLLEEIAQRERTEQALKESEEQLRQSQKLEALGTLAGGVAHDFNNILTVISGYAQMLKLEVPSGTVRDDIEQIDVAAGRATSLVRQLLAFSRKQVLQLRVLDLNHTIEGLEKLLRRLIGEDIEFVTDCAPDLGRVRADPGQIEQVLMNLVVNARDAMVAGGRVTIETRNVKLDEAFEQRPEAIPAGPAVMLAVSDTGMGMDAATRARIFEPFFTTKEPGKGTGLGLATVYGIVRQSGGNITVYSTPGAGTTFRIHFPLAVGADDGASALSGPLASVRGTETVLLVEDDGQVRGLMRRSLESRGFIVLAASQGSEALQMAEEHDGPIDLLITDVVMPNMDGGKLAQRLRAARPEVRVLFVSGYAADAAQMRGRVLPDVPLLHKPVEPDLLLRTTRELLDGR